MWHEEKEPDQRAGKNGMHSDTAWKQARLVPKSLYENMSACSPTQRDQSIFGQAYYQHIEEDIVFRAVSKRGESFSFL